MIQSISTGRVAGGETGDQDRWRSLLPSALPSPSPLRPSANAPSFSAAHLTNSSIPLSPTLILSPIPASGLPHQASRIRPIRPPPHQTRRGGDGGRVLRSDRGAGAHGAGPLRCSRRAGRAAVGPGAAAGAGLLRPGRERDSYCALEVFDWLRKENRVDAETMELMVSIACGWMERLIGGEHEVGDVVALLNEMDCVGLDPGFSMVEKVVSLYWEKGKKNEAVAFVKDVLRRGGVGSSKIEDGGVGDRGLVGYLVWKMMVDGNYLEAVQLVIDFKENQLKPELYSYVIALTALVKEQKEFSKALRKLKASIKTGAIDKLDVENLSSIEKYQSVLISNGILLSNWALQEGSSMVSGVVHERLLSLYTCAGLGLEGGASNYG